jgi:DnaJ-class molecular chaperone
VILAERVLRAWFADEARPNELKTLYAVLGVAQTVTADEIKSAYRRMALQWHPDVARGEPDAHTIFIAIKHAYDILSNPTMRAKYNAGLQLAALAQISAPTQQYSQADATYRAPLRCGYILASGVEQLGRFLVNQIDAWEDIVGADGKVLATSWPLGADHFEEVWL